MNHIEIPKEHREEPLENPTDPQDPADIHAEKTPEDPDEIHDPFETASLSLLITTGKINGAPARMIIDDRVCCVNGEQVLTKT